MRLLLITAAILCAVSARQFLTEDEVLDELNYRSSTRHKRALCGSDGYPQPTPDPHCLGCRCFTPFPGPILRQAGGSSSLTSSLGSASLSRVGKRSTFLPRPLPGPICDYNRCCVARPVPFAASGSAAKSSLSDASVNRMASSLIHSIGKRSADGNAKFKKASMDLVFLIDDSGSIPSSQFSVAKEGAAILSRALCPRKFGNGYGEKQISVVQFGTTPKTVLSFKDSRKGGTYVENAILGMRQRRGTTATVDALEHVRTEILTSEGSRVNDRNSATIVFVITDGKCNQRICNQLGSASRRLRETGRGVQVFAFGVGEADCNELEIIRGEDAGEVFGLPNFDFFEKLAKAVEQQLEDNDSACVA